MTNTYYFIAGVLAILIGLVHSALGERLMFRGMRGSGELVPRQGGQLLLPRQLGIIWASWHALSVLGWGMGAILLGMSWGGLVEPSPLLVHAMAWSMLVSAALVLIGTRGRHPGWIGLTVVAVLIWLGS